MPKLTQKTLHLFLFTLKQRGNITSVTVSKVMTLMMMMSSWIMMTFRKIMTKPTGGTSSTDSSSDFLSIAMDCTDDPIKRRETNIKFRHLQISILYCHGSHVGARPKLLAAQKILITPQNAKPCLLLQSC